MSPLIAASLIISGLAITISTLAICILRCTNREPRP